MAVQKQKVVYSNPPKKRNNFLLINILLLFLFLALIIKLFLIDFIYLYGQNKYEKKEYEISAEIFQTVCPLKANNNECMYLLTSSLANLPLTYNNQKKLVEIASMDNDSAAQFLASQILQEFKNKINHKFSPHYIEKALYNDTVIRWNLPGEALSYYIQDTAGVPSYYYSIIQDSFKTWTLSTKGLAKFRQTANKNDAQIIVSFINEEPKDCHGEHCEYSVGTTVPFIENKHLKYMDVKIRTKNNLNNFFTPPELRTVTLHEIAHALGIWGHSDNPGNIMYYSVNKAYSYTNKRTLSLEDINTLRLLYLLAPDVTNNNIKLSFKQKLIYSPVIAKSFIKGDLSEIEKSIQFVKENPNDLNRWIELASAYSEKRQYQKSINILTNIISLTNNSHIKTIILFNLANDYLNLKEYPKAMNAALNAQSYSNDSDIKSLIAYINYKSGNIEKAQAQMEALQQQSPDDINITLNLTDLYINTKQFIKARKILKELYNANPEAENDERLLGYKKYTIF